MAVNEEHRKLIGKLEEGTPVVIPLYEDDDGERPNRNARAILELLRISGISRGPGLLR